MVLESRFGKQASRTTQRYRDAGNREHLKHHRDVIRFARTPYAQDPRCFIASAIYGPDAWETNVLRAWRDRVLMARWWGRGVIAFYYMVSPFVANLLASFPVLQNTARAMLDRFVEWTSTSR